VRTVIFVNEFT